MAEPMTHSEALEYAIDWMSRQLDSLDRMSPERAIVERFTALYTERRRLLRDLRSAALELDQARTARRRDTGEQGQ